MSRRSAAIIPSPGGVPLPVITLTARGTSEIDILAVPGARTDVARYQIDFALAANGPWSTLTISFPNINQSLLVAHNGLMPGTVVYYRARITYKTGRISGYSFPAAIATASTFSGVAAAVAAATGSLTTGSGGSSGPMRLTQGSLVWPDNQYLSGTAMTVIKSNFPGIRTNHLMKGCYVSMVLADITTTVQGDLSKGFGLMDQLIGVGGLASTADHPMAFVFEIWHSIFNKQTISPSDWPQYWINNGWLKVVASNSATNPLFRVVPNWDNDAVWADLTNICVSICQKYNSNQYFGGFGPMDETDAVSVDIVTGHSVLNSAHYNQKLQQLLLDIKAALPSAPVYANFNYLPPGDSTTPTTMASMINALEAAYPRGFVHGGPDPFVRQTTFQKLVAGLLPTSGMGDIRRNILLINRVQEVFLGNNGSPPTNPGVTPLQIYDTGVNNNAVVMSWNWEAWEFYKWVDQLAAITQRNGVVGVPPAGNYTII